MSPKIMKIDMPISNTDETDGLVSSAISPIGQRRVTPEMLMALDTLASEEVPPSAIMTRPGRGGKVFSYVSHIWVTQKLRDALGMLWSMRVVDYQVFDDSALAIVELTIHAPLEDGSTMDVVITEVGSFDGGGGKMAKAMMVAAAASRGLCRCVMRRFGVGKEFYDEGEQPSLKEAWEAIKRHGERQGLSEEEIISVLTANGVDRKNLRDDFVEAWKMITFAGTKKAEREVEFGSDKDEERTAEVGEGEPGN